MPKNVRFLDQVSVSAFGSEGGGNSVSASYAETASFAHSATSASYAVTASYAVSASHEIIKEVSSSHADTASFAQSGDGIFSGSFSGSFEGNGSGLTNIPASGVIGLPVVNGTANTIPIFTSGNAVGDSTIVYDGSESWDWNVGGGLLKLSTSNLSYVSIFPSSGNMRFELNSGASQEFSWNTITGNQILTFPSATGTLALLNSNNYSATGSFSGSFIGDGSGLTGISHPTSSISSSYALTASYVETAQTASYVLNAISSSYALTASYAVSASHEIIKEISSSHADTASFAQSGNGIFSGSFSGSYVGDGSGLTNVPTPTTASYALTASYVETAQTASYVLNAVSSSYSTFAVSASYAVSASHEIIKEISSSHADTASFAQSGNGVFSGSFSGSYVGDGSGLTGVGGDPFPFSGSAVITGSLVISGIGATPSSFYTTATINATAAATSESIYSLSTSSYDGVFFDYTVSSASNARAGNIMSVWNGGNLVYTENTTTDIGSTVGVIFNVEISQSQAQLISVTDTAGWKIKTTIRSI